MRVLLTDDESVSNFISKKLFEFIGSQVEIYTVQNGAEGLELVTSHFNKSGMLPDIILLDINMP